MATTATPVQVPDEHRFRVSAAARAMEYGIDENGRGFRLYREVDRSEVSGTGYVAEGIELPGGLILMWWTVPDKPSTCTLLQSCTDIPIIRGDEGGSRIEWLDETPPGA